MAGHSGFCAGLNDAQWAVAAPLLPAEARCTQGLRMKFRIGFA